MLKITILLFLLGLFQLLDGQERNLLTSRYDTEFLINNLVSKDAYKPLPDISSDSWKEIKPDQREAIITSAENYINYNYPTILAIEYLDFLRTGNRSRFSSIYNKRREALSTLILAEILEGNSRFMDAIANGIWAICEETSWVIPAHISVQKAGVGLPDVREPVTGIVGAETASILAAAEYFLGAKLDLVSPRIRERMYHEVQHRFLRVMQERKDLWWMGYEGSFTNNWNPWVISNYLNATLVFVEDAGMRSRHVYKAMEILDNFLNIYPDDGGCDEGPAYWNHAAGRVFLCLEQLYSATGGKINIYGEELIRNMGNYLWKAHINDSWFVNFADAPAKMSPDPYLVFNYGKRIQSTQLMALASHFYQPGRIKGVKTTGFMLLNIPELLAKDEIGDFHSEYKTESFILLPDLELAVVREKPVSNEGFYFSMKGGYNQESHNHNDAGNFIVYLDGKPLLVDAGVGEYTAKTFSDERYDIWTMQSAFHNLPTFNGYMQEFGYEYKALGFKAEDMIDSAFCFAELHEAYPEDAGVLYYSRKVSMNRKEQTLAINESIEFQENNNEMRFNFLFAAEPQLDNGLIRLNLQGMEKPAAILRYPKDCKISLEEIPLDDSRLERSWGKNLYRVQLIYQTENKDSDFLFSIEKSN